MRKIYENMKTKNYIDKKLKSESDSNSDNDSNSDSDSGTNNEEQIQKKVNLIIIMNKLFKLNQCSHSFLYIIKKI